MFGLPQFDITADVYRLPFIYDFNSRVFFDTLPCQLRLYGPYPRFTLAFAAGNVVSEGQAAVLFPHGTDIRDESCTPAADLLEVPTGSGRWYLVAYVDDVGKGFPNEYRMAIVWKVFGDDGLTFFNFPPWPVPIP
jgi:hypothetical protein